MLYLILIKIMIIFFKVFIYLEFGKVGIFLLKNNKINLIYLYGRRIGKCEDKEWVFYEKMVF